jgi:hypothetical protein
MERHEKARAIVRCVQNGSYCVDLPLILLARANVVSIDMIAAFQIFSSSRLWGVVDKTATGEK